MVKNNNTSFFNNNLTKIRTNSRLANLMKKNNSININKTGKPGKMKGYIIVFVLCGCAAVLIKFWFGLLSDKKIQNWNPDVEDDVKLERTQKRGTAISIAIMASAVIQAIMKGAGASQTMLLLLYGFIMAAVIGFCGDQAYGKDEGYSFYSIGKTAGKFGGLSGVATQFKYIFGSIQSYEFCRYIVTVFLDMFISMPLQSVITSVCNSQVDSIKNIVPLMPFGFRAVLRAFVNNFDNALQSFVAFITFLAYANETRFKWAYPGKNIDQSKLIPTITIKLATAIAGIVYLIANVSADFNIIDGVKVKTGSSLVDRLDRKLIFVIFIILAMTLGSETSLPFGFMNYEPNTFYIAPIQKYKDLKNFWKVDIDKAKKCNENKNEECKTGEFSYCNVDPETGELTQNSKNNIEIEDTLPLPSKPEITEPALPNDPGSGINYFKDKYKGKKFYDIGLYCTIGIVVISVILFFVGKNIESTMIKWVLPLIFSLGLVGTIPLIEHYVPEKEKDANKTTCELKQTDGSACYIPDNAYNNNCITHTPPGNTPPEKKTNQNEGTFAKKVDMAVYKKHNKNIVDKYETLEKSFKGFMLLYLFVVIGYIVPFIPSKSIYEPHEIQNSSYWKMIIMFIITGIILGGMFTTSILFSPSIEELKKAEENIIDINIDSGSTTDYWSKF